MLSHELADGSNAACQHNGVNDCTEEVVCRYQSHPETRGLAVEMILQCCIINLFLGDQRRSSCCALSKGKDNSVFAIKVVRPKFTQKIPPKELN